MSRLHRGVSAVNELPKPFHGNQTSAVAIPSGKPGGAGQGAVPTPLRSGRCPPRCLGRRLERSRDADGSMQRGNSIAYEE